MKTLLRLACLILPFVLSGCNTAPSTPEGTVRMTLRGQQEGTAAIQICAPETSITQLSRMLDGGNTTSLFELALVWSDGPGSSLSVATTTQHPPRLLSSGRAHPDDRLSITVSIIEPNPALSPLPPEVLIQNDENRVVDLPGDEFDLYRERSWGDREELRPPSGAWQGSRVSISCRTDAFSIEWFEGHSLCYYSFSEADLYYSVTTGRAWLQYWPQVIDASVQAIARYREQCR